MYKTRHFKEYACHEFTSKHYINFAIIYNLYDRKINNSYVIFLCLCETRVSKNTKDK